jgi:LysM repeat protein
MASLAAAVVFSAAARLPEARASTPPTSRAPVHEVELEPGALAAVSTWTVEVEKGDTLSEIAQRSLGSARRSGDIQRLNPRVDAKALRVGQALLLPPSKIPPGSKWMDFVVAAPGGAMRAVGLGEPATLPLGPVRVFAVPHERLVVLRAAARGPDVTEAALRSDPQVAESAPIEASAGDGRVLARAVTRVRVSGISGRTLRIDIVEQNLYGATGHRVAPTAESDTGGSWAVPLLLVLAGLVVFGLVALAARRMAAVEERGSGAT